ncbi:MAG: septal ring lytic transglycosylase RlpA family protein [Alphaproteobacteria bacterium]|nr:septal ring lytic transglycosylase RlpA family protein [Alphaproteobacteria bacterium]
MRMPAAAGVYKIGKPYEIDGTWYYPREQPHYDKTGIASWYGPTFYGKRTADGELFNPNALDAAHRTLPLPVNVRVTNLQNGRSLVVRVNDRGPFVKGRIIDVTPAAAKLLGFYRQGTAEVRVTYVGRAPLNPSAPATDQTPAQIASALPAVPTGTVSVAPLGGAPAASSAPAPSNQVAVNTLPTYTLPADDQVTGIVTKVPVPKVTHIYVQAGAFINYSNALRLKRRLRVAGNLKISSIDIRGKRFYRVRLGPYDRVSQADAALDRLTKAGSSDAAIVVDR